MFSTEYYKEIKTAFDAQMALLDARLQELGQRAEQENCVGIGRSAEGNCNAEKAADTSSFAPTVCGIEKLTGMSDLTGTLLREKKEEIMRVMEQCTEEEREALTFLYSAMPLSDLLDYPASLFLTYAKHGVFLWNKGAFAGKVPEKLFANYVLHYRVNNEDIADTRGFFYDKVSGVIGTGSMYKAVIDANYWCAREATYRASDGRTQNPRTMFGTAMGRCGEESTFGVTVLRSIGIPARQVYAPLWTHCDDNHAWVEAWCDGKWYFLGACEPEESLNKGWFIEPASRGVLLHSRWFGKDEPEETQVGPRGMAKVLNHLGRYAHTMPLTVKVKDEEGKPVPGALVDFQVLNHGAFGTVALVRTGSGETDCGEAKLITGFGDLWISASAHRASKEEKLYGETMVSLIGMEAGQEAACEIVLKSRPECWEGWKELEIHAPKPGNIHDGSLTEEQEQIGKKRLAQAAEYRRKKAKSFYDAREAQRVLGRFQGEDRTLLEDILHKAHSNMGEIVRFLEWDCAGWVPSGWPMGRTDHWKLEALKSLREKDYWDSRADILIDCAVSALPYAGSVPDEIFFRFLFCPRVSNEMLRPCRSLLARWAGKDIRAAVHENPGCLPELADRWIISMPDQEYEGLITSPQGCLRGGIGSRHSKEVFCVNLYRALGIPARLSYFDDRIEYYQDGQFVAADGVEESAVLTLCESSSLKLEDLEHYSVERFEEDGFYRLGLWGKADQAEGGRLVLRLRPGIYRVVTTNRAKSGDQLVKMAVFALKDGEGREITLSLREIQTEDMLTRSRVEDFALRTMDGQEKKMSELAGNGKALFLWLEVTREPTEHILNELYEKSGDFAALETPLYAVLKSQEDLENATLAHTVSALPNLRFLLDDFGENYRKLAESVGREPGRLPLAVVVDGGEECIYSDAGYNVGLADSLWRILV